MMGGREQGIRYDNYRIIDRALRAGFMTQLEIATMTGMSLRTVQRRALKIRPEGSPGIEMKRLGAKKALDAAYRRFEECSNKTNYDALMEAQKHYRDTFNS